MGPLVKTITALVAGIIGVVALEIAMVVKVMGQKEKSEHVQCLEARDH